MRRGGAFNNNQRNARCAYRNNNHPDNINNNLGFRVVLSTLSRYCSPEILRANPVRRRGSN